MNERIRQLAEQATVIRKTFHGVEHVEFDKEKFAELIINECAEIADKNSPMSYPDHGLKIKRHFGIE